MEIEVIGSGCRTCKTLYERTQEAVAGLGLATTVVYTTDIRKIVTMGLMASPVLLVNGKPVLVGGLPSVEEITQLIQNAK